MNYHMACCKPWTRLVCRFFFCYSSRLINVSLLLCSKISPSHLFVYVLIHDNSALLNMCYKLFLLLFSFSFFSLLWFFNLYNKLFNPLLPYIMHLCIGVWKWVSFIGSQNICKSSMFSSSSVTYAGLPL